MKRVIQFNNKEQGNRGGRIKRMVRLTRGGGGIRGTNMGENIAETKAGTSVRAERTREERVWEKAIPRKWGDSLPIRKGEKVLENGVWNREEGGGAFTKIKRKVCQKGRKTATERKKVKKEYKAKCQKGS